MPFRTLTNTLSVFGRTVEAQPLDQGRPVYAHHNWQDPYEVQTSYDVERLFSTFGNREQYVAQGLRPLRSFGMSAISDQFKAGHLEQFLARTSPRESLTLASDFDFFGFGLGQSWKMPLDCDSTEVTNLTATAIYADGLDTRRFFEGQGVFLVPPYNTKVLRFNDTISLPALYSVIQPGSMTTGDPTKLVLSPPPSDYTSDAQPPLTIGWRVVPAVDCVPLLEAPSSYQTAKVLEANVAGTEYPGTGVLPASAVAGAFPPGYGTFTGQSSVERLVFPVDHNWREALSVKYVRPGSETFDGRVRMTGERPRWHIEVNSLAMSRQEWYSILEAFDATQGGARPMWVVSPTVIYEKGLRSGSNRLVVPIGGNLTEFLSTTVGTAFEYDGDWYVNEISTGSPVLGGQGQVTAWNLDMHNTVFQIPGNNYTTCLKRAFPGRFSGPLRESWLSRNVCEVSFTIVECEDKTPEALT